MSKEILDYLKRIEAKMDEKFEQIDKKFEKVDKRLDSHEQMLAQLIDLTKATNQRLTQFEKETNRHLDTIELKLNRFEADFNLLFHESNEQKREINYIKQKIV